MRIELLGEDGRLLTREITQHTANPNQRVSLSTDLDFEIEAVAETGTLILSVDDAFGRTTALSSNEIILLSAGPSDINPGGDLLAPIAILEPEANSLTEGGELLVTGLARPATGQPLVIELFTQDGKIVGSRQAAVEEGLPGEHRFFTAIVPYTLSEPTQILLVIRERSDRFVGNTHIVSQKIVLAP